MLDGLGQAEAGIGDQVGCQLQRRVCDPALETAALAAVACLRHSGQVVAAANNDRGLF